MSRLCRFPVEFNTGSATWATYLIQIQFTLPQNRNNLMMNRTSQSPLGLTSLPRKVNSKALLKVTGFLIIISLICCVFLSKYFCFSYFL